MKANYLEFKIGLVTVLGLIFAAAFLLVVEQHNPFQNTYLMRVLFHDAQQLLKGAPVNMSGVRIGRVKELDLMSYGENQEIMVVVTLEIYNNYRIVRDSKIKIASSGLFGTNFIKISVPEIKDGENLLFIPPDEQELLYGESPATMEDLMEKGKATFSKVDKLLNHANSFLGDPELKSSLHTTIRNIGSAAQKAEVLFKDIDREVNNISRDINATIKKVHSIISQNESSISSMVTNFKEFSAEIAEIAGNNKTKISSIVKRIDEITAGLEDNGEFSSAMRRIRQNFVEASENLHGVTDKVRHMFDDHNFENKVYETIDSATGAAKAITQIKQDIYSMKTSFSTQILYNEKQEDYESNVYFDTTFKDRYTFRTGLESPGSEQYSVFQGGIKKGSLSLRAGVIRDDFGVSIAKKISSELEVGLEAFDVNKPVHRIYSQLNLNSGSSLVLKYHDFSRPENAQFLLGFSHRF
jgi:ABC-type transporter Mla subunit MlaD